ncbi:MAG TPA: IS66 family transposase [Polyangiales bacterium]|nr:IS66 family transposase [Polyangiales bacterium]
MARKHDKRKAAAKTSKTGAARPCAQVDLLRAQAGALSFSDEQQAFVATLLSSLANVGREYDALAQDRDALAQDRDALAQDRDALTQDRDAMASEIERLELRVKKLTILRYGKRTERLTGEEIVQLALALGATEEEASAPEPLVPCTPAPEETVALGDDEVADPPASEPAASNKPKKRRPNHPGRTKLAPHIERILLPEIRVPAAHRACCTCGEEMKGITHLSHERVEYVPAKIVVHVERRETLACKNSACRKDIVTAPSAAGEATRRRAGASLLAYLVEAKCDDGMPIERLRDQLHRLGFDIPINTLYTYWTHATTVLLRVAEVLRAQVLADPIVRVDDTGLPVLDKTHKSGIYRGHLWCFAGTRPLVAYAFTQGWSADEIEPYLSAIEGLIQCDDYKGYSSQTTLPDGTKRALVDPERRLGCLMHVRRRFLEALKLGDKRAARGLELIGALYAIERIAKDAGASADERLELRTHFSLPLLDAFDAWVDELAPRCLPRSPLGEAVRYAKQQRPYVRRCFTDGRFEIDNGLVERTLREPCMGRKAYLFTGSAKAAERLAGAYSLVQSCRLLGISTRDYLIDVLTKLDAGWSIQRLDELVPDRWARDRGLLTQREQA